jgi:hypothetical protein
MSVGMAYMSLSVKKARKVSGSRDGRRSASRKRALVFQAFIQEESFLAPASRLVACRDACTRCRQKKHILSFTSSRACF